MVGTCLSYPPTGAALTVPSALYLIIHLFPDPLQQSKAIATFGSFGAIGNGRTVFALLFAIKVLNIAACPGNSYRACYWCIHCPVGNMAVAFLRFHHNWSSCIRCRRHLITVS